MYATHPKHHEWFPFVLFANLPAAESSTKELPQFTHVVLTDVRELYLPSSSTFVSISFSENRTLLMSDGNVRSNTEEAALHLIRCKVGRGLFAILLHGLLKQLLRGIPVSCMIRSNIYLRGVKRRMAKLDFKQLQLAEGRLEARLSVSDPLSANLRNAAARSSWLHEIVTAYIPMQQLVCII
jgi:hypothetical protein